MRAGSLEQAADAGRKLEHSIDAYHQQFQRDTWESGTPLELLADMHPTGTGNEVVGSHLKLGCILSTLAAL
jgi:hypothetical protein